MRSPAAPKGNSLFGVDRLNVRHPLDLESLMSVSAAGLRQGLGWRCILVFVTESARELALYLLVGLGACPVKTLPRRG